MIPILAVLSESSSVEPTSVTRSGTLWEIDLTWPLVCVATIFAAAMIVWAIRRKKKL